MTPQRFERLCQVLATRQPDLTVITDFVHKPRNLSAIVRNCDAVGIMRVHAVIGKEDYRAFRGTTMGSHLWVEVRPWPTLEEAVKPLRSDGFQVVAAHMGERSRDFREIDYTVPTALLMGAEKAGVSASGQAIADHHISIPMVGMVGSYNVSVAAGIILAEAQRQRQRAGCYDSQRIAEVDYQRLMFQWSQPRLRKFCDSHGLQYPPLDAAGELLDAPAWYASVRAGTAPLVPEQKGTERE